MRDSAVTPMRPPGNVGYRQFDARTDTGRPATAQRGVYLDARVEALSHRMQDARQAADRLGWSVAPVQSARCSEAAGGCPEPIVASASAAPGATSSRDASAVGAFLSRPRRDTGVDRPVVSPMPTDATESDVVSEPVPRQWPIRTRYTVSEVLRSLSSCSAPFTHASHLADEMWALSSHPRFTAEGRALLHNVATIADQLAALAPQVFTLQSVCGLFRIAADLLDGKPPEAGDVMGVNSFGRQLMSFMRVDGPLHRSKEMPGASRT